MKERSAAIDYIKGLAVISVICAHCCNLYNSSSAFADMGSLFLQNVGTFGVICFMVISGMLFRAPQKENFTKFWLKKLKGIVIPWLISGTCVWLYVYLRQPPLTFGSLANFLIGNGSYLYYLTMLILFYGIFSLPFMRSKIVLVLCIAATMVSCLWFYEIGNLSPYLNPLNWIGFFALGIYIARRKTARVHGGGMKTLFSCATWVLCAGLITIQLIRKDGGYYFGGLRAITSWTGAASVAMLGICLSGSKETKLMKLLGYVGKNSFFVYIWHMPIAGIVARLASIGPLQYTVLLRPFVVLAVVMVAYKIAEVLLRKLKLGKLGFLMGINR